MSNQVQAAALAVKESPEAFYKRISLSDSGETSHMGGIYLHKDFAKFIFDKPGKKGTNKERIANITWYDGKKSLLCRFCYYGKGTRNEYRITRLSRTFKAGQFVIFIKVSNDSYQGFLLEEEDISIFYSKFNQ